jgi:hypothetical protein
VRRLRTSNPFLGPSYRPFAEPEVCICGMQYTTEWAHRQTAWHKQSEAIYRRKVRVHALTERMNLMYANERVPTKRQIKRARGYLKEAV